MKENNLFISVIDYNFLAFFISLHLNVKNAKLPGYMVNVLVSALLISLL